MLLTKPLGVALRTPPCTRRCQKYRYIAYYYICPHTVYLHFRQRLTYYYYYHIYIYIYICMYVCIYIKGACKELADAAQVLLLYIYTERERERERDTVDTNAAAKELADAVHVCGRMLTNAGVCRRMRPQPQQQA